MHSQLRTLSISLAASGKATSKGLFITVDVPVFAHVLLGGEPLVAAGTDEIADVEMGSADVTLEVEFGCIALRAIRVETRELVSVHFNISRSYTEERLNSTAEDFELESA